MTLDQAYLTASDDQLFEELGAILLGDGLGAGGIDAQESLRVAKKWFTTRTAELQKAVCQSSIAAQIRGNAADDISILVVALVAHNDGWTAIALPVAAIILRRGLMGFCATSERA